MAATRAIRLQTEIPGPRSREILERKERVVAVGNRIAEEGDGEGLGLA